MRGFCYTFPEPEKDRGYRSVTEAVSTDSYVRNGMTITHIMETIKTVTLGGREERVIRHTTMAGGSKVMIARVRNTFHHDTYITMEASNSADADYSGSGGIKGDGDNEEPRSKFEKQKAQAEHRERESRRPTSLDSEVREQ